MRRKKVFTCHRLERQRHGDQSDDPPHQ
jgi:hypothetical protein